MESIKNSVTKSLSGLKGTNRGGLSTITPGQWVALVAVGLFVFTQVFEISIQAKPRLWSGGKAELLSTAREQSENNSEKSDLVLGGEVFPEEGITIPVRWGDLGKKMIDAGVIDDEKFSAIYAQRGGIGEETQQLLSDSQNGEIRMTAENSGVILNLLWAFGLANKNSILEEGPMQSPQYGGDASRFASTGGWSLAKGNVMDHYSAHQFVALSDKQQKLVEMVSQGIYRPCCGNSTYFPDCNHGMAMLGLLELLAAEGLNEKEMYKVALEVNSYWFPDTYLTLAKYFAKRGVAWQDVDPKEVLGSTYSSAQGYRQILAEVEPVQGGGGGGCGV